MAAKSRYRIRKKWFSLPNGDFLWLYTPQKKVWFFWINIGRRCDSEQFPRQRIQEYKENRYKTTYLYL